MTETGPRVTDADVRRFEEQLGHELPADYRAFLVAINGGHASADHCVFRVGRDESVLNSLYSLNAGNQRDVLATRQQSPRTHSDLPAGALAIGYDDGGGRIVLPLTGPHRGEVWYLDTGNPRPEGSNPRVEWFDRRDVFRLAGSFREFMAGLRPLDDAGASAAL